MVRALLLAALLALGVPPAAAGEDPLPARVNRAIDRGAANLVSRQAADGSWQKEDKVHPLGRTALCAFTLLHAGRPAEDPSIRRAMESLGIPAGYGGRVAPRSTYEASCLVLLLNALGKGY